MMETQQTPAPIYCIACGEGFVGLDLLERWLWIHEHFLCWSFLGLDNYDDIL